MLKSLKYIFLLLAFNAVVVIGFAQAPTITAIEYPSNYPGEVMVISGLNYSTSPSKMVVLFGGVKGEVLSTDGSNMLVKIPGNASASNIDVINLDTKLSVSSAAKFFPTFHGSVFNQLDYDPALKFTSVGQPYDVCACDLDGDGLRDMVTTRSSDEQSIVVYHNTTIDPTNIQFTQSSIPVSTTSQNITCGDLNGDGKPEVIFGRRVTGNSNFVHVLANSSTVGNIAFGGTSILNLATGDEATKIVLNDLNFDGKPEVIVTNIKRNVISIFRNQSSGGSISFANSPDEIEVVGATTTRGMEMQDMDGDGKPEMIITQFSDENVYILKNNSEVGTIAFDDAIEFPLDKSIRNVKVGDFDLDGKPDIAVTHTIETSMSVVRNISTASDLDFELAGNWVTNTEPWGVDVADMDGDGDLEIVVTNNGFNSINIYENKHTNTSSTIDFTTHTLTVDKTTRNVLLADMNNDAKPDLLFTSADRLGNGLYYLGLIRNKNCFVPEIYGDASQYICDQPIELESIYNPGAVYNWYKDGVLEQGPAHATNTANQPTLTVTAAAVYKLIMEAEGGNCNLESNEITVVQESGSVPGTPTAINDGPGCEGDDIQLSVAFASAPPAGITYKWTGPNGFSSTSATPTLSNVSAADVGNYIVTVADGLCKTNEVSTIVEVTELPPFSVTATTDIAFCSGGSASLQVTTRSGYSYQWLFDGNVLSGETGTNITVSDAGIYSVEVTENASACSSITNEVQLSIFDAITATPEIVSSPCLDANIMFTSDNSVVDPTATLNYLWDFGNGETSTDANPTNSYLSIGDYTVQLTVGYDEANCPDTQTLNVTVLAPEVLEIVASDDGVCGGDSEVELSTNITITNPDWSTNETANTIIINAAGDYTVSGNDSNGCDVSANISLPEKDQPRLVVTANPSNGIVSGDGVDLEATGADTYAWYPAETLNDTTISNPRGTPTETIQYYVEGTSSDGCTVLDSILVEVRAAISSAYKVLRPDGPVKTLLFENKADASSCILTVFDRNGSKVFEAEGNTVEWDGTGNRGELPQGTYYYVFGCGDNEPGTGSILLVRS